jgi:hypothetical protein
MAFDTKRRTLVFDELLWPRIATGDRKNGTQEIALQSRVSISDYRAHVATGDAQSLPPLS